MFKTETEVRNWKVTMAEGKFTVKPYPQTFSSLEDVVMVSEASEVFVRERCHGTLSTYVYVLYPPPPPSCSCRQWEKPTTLP